MRANRDPEKNEVAHLEAECPLAGKKVLEIGCGHGQIAWRYAARTHIWVGFDPAWSELQQGRIEAPSDLSDACLVQARGEDIPMPPRYFDLALFASSL